MNTEADVLEFLANDDQKSPYSAFYECDQRTAYLYLVMDEEVVGDVWLYNLAETPDEPQWDDPEQLPFLNAREYVVDVRFPPVVSEDEIVFHWHHRGENFDHLDLHVRGELLARVSDGSKPGWCRLAKIDGPLAKRLSGSASEAKPL